MTTGRGSKRATKSDWSAMLSNAPRPPGFPKRNATADELEGDADVSGSDAVVDVSTSSRPSAGRSSRTSRPSPGDDVPVFSDDVTMSDGDVADDVVRVSDGASDLDVDGGGAVVRSPAASRSPGRVRVRLSYPKSTVWVPERVRARMREVTAASGLSVTDVVVSAFNHRYDQFGDWFVRPMMVAGPMPERTMRRRRMPKTTLVQLYLYLTLEQERVLDEAVAACAAGSRSAFVTRLLEAEFDLV